MTVQSAESLRPKRKAVAVAVGVFFSLAVVELGVRILGLGAPIPDDLNHDRGTYTEELNSLGFHDYEWMLVKPPGTTRVILLGDSFTAGRKIPLGKLFAKRIERSLNRQASEHRYELVNLARSGWDTEQEVDWLEAALEMGANPDSVLIVFFVNDGAHLAKKGDPVFRQLNAKLFAREGLLNQWSRAYDYFDFRFRHRKVKRETALNYERSYMGDHDYQDRWRACQSALARAKALSVEHEFRLGLVIFPLLIELEEGHFLEGVYELVETTCREIGFPARSLLPTFLGREPATLWCAPYDAHPNIQANALVADPIERFLIEEGLVPEPSAN